MHALEIGMHNMTTVRFYAHDMAFCCNTLYNISAGNSGLPLRLSGRVEWRYIDCQLSRPYAYVNFQTPQGLVCNSDKFRLKPD